MFDDSSAYSKPWNEAAFTHMVKVLEALPSSIILHEEAAEDGTPKKSKRVADGQLSFSLSSRKKNGKFDPSDFTTYNTNQYEFVQFLKTGVLKDSDKKILD